MDEVKRVLNRIAPGLPQFIELLTGRGIDELYTSGELKRVLIFNIFTSIIPLLVG